MTEIKQVQEKDLHCLVLRDASLRKRILNVWRRCRIDWSFATKRFSAFLRSERNISSQERRLISEIIFGMIRHLRRLDEALRLGGYRSSQTPDEERLVAYLVLEGGVPVSDAVRHNSDVDWQIVARADEMILKTKKRVQRLGLFYSLPPWLATILVREYGDEAEDIARSCNCRAAVTIRANTLVTHRSELKKLLSEIGIETREAHLSPDALYVDARTNIRSSDLFKNGMFEFQDEGSQMVSDIVARLAEHTRAQKCKVVDFCAGAGGKTLGIAAHLQNKGRILAGDVDRGKLQELKKRLRRNSVANVQVVNWEEVEALSAFVDSSHVVLVDAPCTGTGVLRRHPETKWRLDKNSPKTFQKIQTELLYKAMPYVAPGAYLVYVTCSLLPEENRGVIERILQQRGDYSRVKVSDFLENETALSFLQDDGHSLQLLPHRHDGDGFFVAVLRRAALGR